MPLRPPQRFTALDRPGTNWSVLDHEIAEQKAQTLARLGHDLEQALARLRAHEADGPGPERDVARSALVDAAAERAWTFMIQRELCGLRFWEAVVKDYGIPREVLNRMGRVTRNGRS